MKKRARILILFAALFLVALLVRPAYAASGGTISNGKGGWSMELNSVSWGGREAKFDIRSWSGDHQKMGKGVTLTKDELISLKNLLNSIDIQ
jgi:hypothetical protein